MLYLNEKVDFFSESRCPEYDFSGEINGLDNQDSFTNFVHLILPAFRGLVPLDDCDEDYEDEYEDEEDSICDGDDFLSGFEDCGSYLQAPDLGYRGFSEDIEYPRYKYKFQFFNDTVEFFWKELDTETQIILSLVAIYVSLGFTGFEHKELPCKIDEYNNSPEYISALLRCSEHIDIKLICNNLGYIKDRKIHGVFFETCKPFKSITEVVSARLLS